MFRLPQPRFSSVSWMKFGHRRPLKKRAKWRGLLGDTDGVKHWVHFINNELVYKHHSKWTPVHPCPEDQCHDITFDDAKSREQYRRMLQAYERGGHVAMEDEHDRMVDEAATGNHGCKTRKFKVPTAAGEPVRGWIRFCLTKTICEQRQRREGKKD